MTPQDQPNHINQLKYILDAVRENQSHERAGITDDEAIAAIKAYFLDLIGEDEEFDHPRGIREDFYLYAKQDGRNELREELREKLK